MGGKKKLTALALGPAAVASTCVSNQQLLSVLTMPDSLFAAL